MTLLAMELFVLAWAGGLRVIGSVLMAGSFGAMITMMAIGLVVG